MHKIISEEQFCSIKGRSIVHCNAFVRDIIYYVNENNLTGSLINLDWSKAFDKVSREFLFKILERFGFKDTFINWVRMLYMGCSSALCINGILSEYFSVERSIRQGCPMSMIAYVIFQEPLYRAIKCSKEIVPITAPNNFIACLAGFADDTSVIVRNDSSIIELNKIIVKFELATGAELNREKTFVMGLGSWKSRDIWPLDWLKVKKECKILGIYFTNDYEESVNKNWVTCIEKVESRIKMLSSRLLSLFQKAIIINVLILSKVWYICHVFPLGRNHAKQIEKHIFHYLWNGCYQPIKRDSLYLDKYSGGIGILNVYHKAEAILVNTYLKGL